MSNDFEAAVASLSFADAVDFACSTKPANISCFQTRKGDFQLDWTGLRIGQLGLQFMSLPVGSCAAIGETAPQGESFHVPIGVPERISIMGHAMGGDQIGAYEARSEHAICGAEGARLVYVVPPPGSLAVMAPVLLEFDFVNGCRGNYLVGSRPESMHVLRSHLENLWLQCSTTPQALLHREVGRNIHESTLELLLTILAPERSLSPRIGRQPVSRPAVLGRIDDCLRQRPDEPVYVSDLCDSAQVSQPTLYRIFHDIFGMGPKQFLQIRRLHQVRRRLLEGDPATLMVSEAAYDFGFWQLGRFSRAYKAFFGETPSSTLRHKRALRARVLPTIQGHYTLSGWSGSN